MFEKKRGAFKTLCDFEMIVAQILIVANIFRPNPGRVQKLHRVHQFSVKAEITRILKVAILILFSFSRGMTVMVDVLIIIGTLPEADIIDDQFEIAFYCFSYRL